MLLLIGSFVWTTPMMCLEQEQPTLSICGPFRENGLATNAARQSNFPKPPMKLWWDDLVNECHVFLTLTATEMHRIPQSAGLQMRFRVDQPVKPHRLHHRSDGSFGVCRHAHMEVSSKTSETDIHIAASAARPPSSYAPWGNPQEGAHRWQGQRIEPCVESHRENEKARHTTRPTQDDGLALWKFEWPSFANCNCFGV
jgi:hypothetical protein